MPRLSRSLGALAALSLAAALWAPSEAKACGGGGFYQVSANETVATTGHRVVIAISKKQSVLWDQMKYQGDPADFAWVYPAKPGTYLEVATGGIVEALDAVTTKVVQSPTVECEEPGGGVESGPSCGCMPGSAKDGGGLDYTNRGGDQDTSVVVKSETTIGPYDTKTISSATPGAVAQWLTDNGYKVPDEVVPILDDYAANGFDFITMRLSPDKGVDQMQPVRVVTPGMNTTFPMRMLTAGASDHMALDVMILSEGRVEVDGFSNVEIHSQDVSWDFDKETSNYADVRAAALGANGGDVFLTSVAAENGLFGIADGAQDSAAILYGNAVTASGQGSACDSQLFKALQNPDDPAAAREVADLCDDQGNCTAPTADQTDSRDFDCGAATDLSTALIGMHPKDVWLTRLEANLPKAALAKDLVIVPANSAEAVSRVLVAGSSTGDACAGAAPATSEPAKKPPVSPSGLVLMGTALALAAAYARRRLGIRERATA